MPKKTALEVLQDHDVLKPRVVIEEAKRAGLPLRYALAMLQKETGIPQHNIFGGDYGPAYKGRPPFYHDNVTEKRVKALLNQPKNNGVGWTQLTFRPFVVEAEKLGGAHRPRFQMRVGFKVLEGLMDQFGPQQGFARYNGSGPAAQVYGQEAMKIANTWGKRLP
jgi:hypothetical protein